MMNLLQFAFRLPNFLFPLLILLFQNSTAQIQPLFGGSPTNGACLSRPPACPLNCANGFVWGLGNSCLCLCQANPCTNRFCPVGEVCTIQSGFAVCSRPAIEASILRPNNQQPQHTRSNTVGECPRLVGGSCMRKCDRDTECATDQRCCSNGCGYECVPAVNVAPIQSSLSIRPIGQFQPQLPSFISPNPQINSFTVAPDSHVGLQKSGRCPPSVTFPPNQQKCNIECQEDGDCGGTLKCCKNNCDGQVCVSPASVVKSSSCVQLLSAVKQLPQQRLKAGYLPTCTGNGNFAPVQCDQQFCWCVSTESGHEVWGTKVELDERARLNCAEPRECETSRKECERKSKNRCTFGWKTDSTGCPSESCECRDLCEEIECGRKFYECQLIEPDCSDPPCQPVPKCILNPCPNGPPATLNNGVTALCTQENPCFPGYWCHEIGYNGLGFCCPEPESAKRSGTTCEARAPSRLASIVSSQDSCESECRVDADCTQDKKCCFDGCSLVCSNGKQSGLLAPKKSNIGGVFAENKALLEALNAECPNFPKPKRAMVCETECQNDSDCHGMRRCCKNGCSMVCSYPSKTTACLHDAITFDLFGLKHAPRCNSQGQYHEIQCDRERCYCAEPNKGRPLPGSLVPAGQRPNCARNRQCPQLNCETNCLHGAQFDENGCPTCDCKNPCRDIECKGNGVCIMVPVECTGNSECNDQPRCVPNICQGQPSSNDYDLIEQCSNDCPNGFSCYSIGLPGAGGLCCPLGISSQGGVRPTTHLGECPKTSIRAQSAFQLMCRADADCAIHEKCCFDGDSGTMCTVIDKGLGSATKSKNSKLDKNKPGECQSIGSNRRDCRSGVDECKDDLDCAGVLKCCEDGCFKKCLPAFKTTACNHLKASLEPFGRSVMIRCTDDGEFEPTQCNNEACWCVEVITGREIEGTRVTGNLKPDCKMRRVCQEKDCKRSLKCENGYKKDRNGCDICECSTPCQGLKCPDEDHVCVSQSVTCLTSDCPPVPKCIPNVCRSGHPLLDKNGVKECSTNGDCSPGSYCRKFGWKSGYCCGGPDNQKNAGKCPKMPDFPIHSISCSIRCRQDSDCSKPHEGCCFNNCGMECMPLSSNGVIPASLSNRHPSISHSVDHTDHHHTQIRPTIESTCPQVQDLGHVICGNARDNHCESDKECPNSLKCCFDGCSRSCMPPSKASNCVHTNAAVQALMRLGNSNLFQPLCTSDSLYARIQRWQNREWCIDQITGRELAGTRTNSGIANCESPRSCRPLTCQLECDFGFRIDDDGCEECACRNPCENVDCPLNHVCRMVGVDCATSKDSNDLSNCQPVPKCILNICLRGEPLTKPNSQLLIKCNGQRKKSCPPGWFCQQFGLESGGYCCAGIVPESQLQLSAQKCSPTPILYSKDVERERKIECRLARDCNQGVEPCCFNGYGSVCLKSVGRSNDLGVLGHSVISHLSKNLVQEVHGISPIKPILSQSDRGTCPLNVFQNPGCKSDCHSDGECGEFKKCCEFGCGKKCLYPDPTSPCIHRLNVLEEEQLKVERPKSLGLVTARKFAKAGDEWQNSTVQCTSSGLYRRIQCNRLIGQCWCVNAADGKEIIGTRSSISSRGEPNCLAPRKCATECQKEWEGCEHGVRVDKNGCPLDNQCECRNPCEDFECLGENEICVLRLVKCSQDPCPKQPTCRPTPCSPLLSSHFVPLTCRRDLECGTSEEEAECRALATSNDETGHRVGICCSLNSVGAQAVPQQKIQTFGADSRNQKMGICPLKRVESGSTKCVKKCSTDEDCLGISKCCTYDGCSSCEKPSPSTNCMHITVAIERLKNDGIPNRLPTPSCDHEIGNYVATQCDENGNCWCVDQTSGVEITATRHSQPTFNVCESERRKCGVECSDELTQTCPFGLDLDSNGCPRTSQCRCKNPCDQVDCPQNEICLLRSRDCFEEICLPVPVCEVNPCPDNQKPILEARGFSQFACFHNRTRACPSNFQCTGFDQRQIGICCPPPHRSNINFHQDADQNGHEIFASCPHGSAYSRTSDEPPTICSTSGQNTCPSTHYCITKPGQLHGNCCPTKRFVCNLERDIASCNRPVTRFYFDADSQACVPFVYGGCEGNLNNFETETACTRFCIGVGSDPLTRLLHGEGDEANFAEKQDQVYSLGFTLTGPLLRQKHTQEFNDRLRDYLMATYNLNENELRDLYVHDDNTVRFNLIAPNAQQKAQNISDAVANGGFHFRYNEESYHAEPQTWFSQQIDTNMRPTISGVLFWILLIASILFALAVIFVLWCACSFVRSRTKDNSSIFRGVSPSPYGQISAYIPQDGRSVSVASSRHSNNPQSNSASHEPPHTNQQKQQKTVSADDLRILRQMERENRQMSSISGAMLQIFQQPVHEASKPRVIQRPKIVGGTDNLEEGLNSRPTNQGRRTNKSTVFY